MTKKRVISGVQATGNLHLGNYIGAISRWVDMQNNYDCFFFLADLHAITIDISKEALESSVTNSVAMYLASGLDHEKSVIFAQSYVKEHAELAWIFNCFTPIGWLKRMTQFKDKAGKNQEQASTGLFTYPVLMAADILLYKAHLVPVGEDQKQHIELTRDIAGAMNRKFGRELLTVPDAMIEEKAARIMSLRDGTKKMSKSDESDKSRINLSDDADLIIDKIKKAKTDNFSHISYDVQNRPDVSNLVTIYSAMSKKPIDLIVQEYEGKNYSEFKQDLADLVVEKLSPIREKYLYYMKNQDFLEHVLRIGAERAQVIALNTVNEVKKAIGYRI